VKRIAWTMLALTMFIGALGPAPAYASTGGGICKLPIIGKLLCPPPPGGGGGGGTSVPEPGTLGVLALGAGAAAWARRRRLQK
jgi:hypothetical protein